MSPQYQPLPTPSQDDADNDDVDDGDYDDGDDMIWGDPDYDEGDNVDGDDDGEAQKSLGRFRNAQENSETLREPQNAQGNSETLREIQKRSGWISETLRKSSETLRNAHDSDVVAMI